ncbi:MAG: DNA repair protein RecN [Firmicutes bacterium]|nr:DNA repair protein RecN [Bacillota bacterium]
MITHISIKDLATIENIDIDLHKGLNVITGETGAGKSVFVEALSLALGSRADSSFVRTGSERAIIQMVCEHNNNDILITREISNSGKNMCRIDDRIVTLGELQELTAKLADIHGQYDNQSLLKVENHLKLVDAYEKGAIAPIKKKVAEYYDNYIDACRRLSEAEQKAENVDQQKEYLRYRIDEIEKAGLLVGEDERHKEELEIMENNEQIYGALDRAFNNAYAREGSALDRLDDVITPIKEISGLSRDAAGFEDEISDFYYRFEDIANRIRDTRDRIVFNRERIEELNDRLYFIGELKAKYGETIDEILNYKDKMEHELLDLADIEADVDSRRLEKSRIEEMLKNETESLSRLRHSSAYNLQSKIQDELENLNFTESNFSISFSTKEEYDPNGTDIVEFLISPNTGEPLKPLSKIASGGEMSRIMLAFKKVIGEYDGIDTMIFDEIDSGISGETAAIVSKELSQIAQSHQIICITHLPPIAAAADHNYRIEKSADSERTYTTMSHLSDNEKITEIARLLAGINISDITLASAKEMIAIATHVK